MNCVFFIFSSCGSDCGSSRTFEQMVLAVCLLHMQDNNRFTYTGIYHISITYNNMVDIITLLLT